MASCEFGYYGEDCSSSMADTKYWLAYRAIVGTVACALVVAMIVCRKYAMRGTTSKVYDMPMDLLFALSGALCVNMILIVPDPLGLGGLYPSYIAGVFFAMPMPVISSMLSVRIVNIKSVHAAAGRQLRFSNQISRVNSRYSFMPSVTDALVWDWRYVVAGVAASAAEVAGSLSSQLAGGVYWAPWVACMCVWYAIRVAAFFRLESMLADVLPSGSIELTRDRSLMTWVGAQQCASVCAWAVLTATVRSVGDPYAVCSALVVFSLVALSTAAANLSTYVDFGASSIRRLSAGSRSTVPCTAVEGVSVSVGV